MWVPWPADSKTFIEMKEAKKSQDILMEEQVRDLAYITARYILSCE
jgi:hypothetical protein